MRILYGLINKTVLDVTRKCLDKLKINGYIIIPTGDEQRVKLFGDPIENYSKKIYVRIGPREISYDANIEVKIDVSKISISDTGTMWTEHIVPIKTQKRMLAKKSRIVPRRTTRRIVHRPKKPVEQAVDVELECSNVSSLDYPLNLYVKKYQNIAEFGKGLYTFDTIKSYEKFEDYESYGSFDFAAWSVIIFNVPPPSFNWPLRGNLNELLIFAYEPDNDMLTEHGYGLIYSRPNIQIWKRQPKIVVYTANYGNYRNEHRFLDEVSVHDGVEYYILSNKNINTNKWVYMHTELQPVLSFMDANRHSSKVAKWITPEMFSDYDIIMWIDSKRQCIKKNITRELLLKYAHMNILMPKHRSRNDCFQEIMTTIKLNLEHKNNAHKFRDKLEEEGVTFANVLPDSHIIIYRNTSENSSSLRKVYDALMEYGLRRDQNVIQYALQNYNTLLF